MASKNYRAKNHHTQNHPVRKNTASNFVKQSGSPKPEKKIVVIVKRIPWGVVAFILTLFLGLTFFDFWANTFGKIFSAGASILSLISALLHVFDIKIIKRIESAVVRDIIAKVSIGLFLGFIATLILHISGYTFTKVPPGDTTSSPTEMEGSSVPVEDPSFDSSEPPNVSPSPAASEETPIESPNVSVEPTISNDEIDVLDPNTVLTMTEKYENEDSFVPEAGEYDLLSAVDDSLLEYDLERTAENKLQWCSLISDSVKKKVNTDAQPDSDTVNGDISFTRIVEEANVLENEMKKNGTARERLEHIIELRETAYQKYPLMDLRVILSNGYHELARIQNGSGEWENSYRSYLKAIAYRLDCIQTTIEINDTYYKHLYHIGILYQCMGDIEALCAESRGEAYFLSACFLEMAAANTYEPENERVGFLSSYYAGMVNHKLSLFQWNDKKGIGYYFILDALSYYEKSLSFENYRKQRSYQYMYLYQVCEIAQQYLRQFYRPTEMLSYNEYENLKSEYREKAK